MAHGPGFEDAAHRAVPRRNVAPQVEDQTLRQIRQARQGHGQGQLRGRLQTGLGKDFVRSCTTGEAEKEKGQEKRSRTRSCFQLQEEELQKVLSALGIVSQPGRQSAADWPKPPRTIPLGRVSDSVSTRTSGSLAGLQGCVFRGGLVPWQPPQGEGGP